MSYQEALEDGVRVEKSAGHATVYYPICHRCGKEARALCYKRGDKYTCCSCKKCKASNVYARKGMARMRKI